MEALERPRRSPGRRRSDVSWTDQQTSQRWHPITFTTRVGGGRLGGAAGQLRRHNLGVVLERLHLRGPASRSELTAETELNRSTIADLIGELIDLGLVEEHPAPVASGPGRPSPVVHPRPQGAVALAVEVAVDSMAVATVGLGGHVYSRSRVARPNARFSPEQTVRDIAGLAAPVLASLPGTHLLDGVGAAVVGTARRADGFVHLAPNLGWQDVPLGALLRAELGTEVPVVVANEADLGALAEHRRGGHTGVDHLIYVSGEVGIGTGVIVDGRPLLGAAGFAGEAGHTLVNPGGHRCRCGAVGCWESEAGEVALLRHAGLEADTGQLDEVAERAAAGDDTTLRALDEVGRWLGLGIGNLVNLFNPQLVVLGGSYQRLFGYLEPAVTDAVCRQALAAPGQMARVVGSTLDADASLIGAAELVLSRVVTDPAGIGDRQR